MLPKKQFKQTDNETTKDLLGTLSTQGLILSSSTHTAKFTLWNEVDCVGKSFQSFVYPDDILRVKNGYIKVLKGETITLKALRCLIRNGTFECFTIDFVPVVRAGAVVEVLVLGGPTARESTTLSSQLFSENNESAASQTLEAAPLTKLLESVLANAPIGFALLDEELRFVCLNRTFSAMTGYSPAQQTGLFFKDLLPSLAHILTPMMKEILATGNSVVDHEVKFPRTGGVDYRYVLLNFYPLPDWKGVICGVAMIAVDITDRKRSDQRLKKLSNELVRSNQALEAFSYVASHDLNEPLSTISCYLQLLEKRYKGKLDQTAKEYIECVIGGTKRMRNLIDGILEYARAGKVTRKLSELDCAELLQTIMGNLKVALEDSHCNLTYDPLPKVFGDKLLLLQVLQNLVANAIKYRAVSKPASPCLIHVGAKKESNQWVLSVSDNGIGIDKENLLTIFEPFKKLHSQSEYAGAGLGLAITQKNVEQMGGKIWATSEKGVGSVFYFTIPANKPGEAEDNFPIPTERSKGLNHESNQRLH